VLGLRGRIRIGRRTRTGSSCLFMIARRGKNYSLRLDWNWLKIKIFSGFGESFYAPGPGCSGNTRDLELSGILPDN